MPGLGREFHAAIKAQLKKLKTNPFFQIRYDNVHCLPLKNLPSRLFNTSGTSISEVFSLPKKWRTYYSCPNHCLAQYKNTSLQVLLKTACEIFNKAFYTVAL
jgi:hypothetical protein